MGVAPSSTRSPTTGDGDGGALGVRWRRAVPVHGSTRAPLAEAAGLAARTGETHPSGTEDKVTGFSDDSGYLADAVAERFWPTDPDRGSAEAGGLKDFYRQADAMQDVTADKLFALAASLPHTGRSA